MNSFWCGLIPILIPHSFMFNNCFDATPASLTVHVPVGTTRVLICRVQGALPELGPAILEEASGHLRREWPDSHSKGLLTSKSQA